MEWYTRNQQQRNPFIDATRSSSFSFFSMVYFSRQSNEIFLNGIEILPNVVKNAKQSMKFAHNCTNSMYFDYYNSDRHALQQQCTNEKKKMCVQIRSTVAFSFLFFVNFFTIYSLDKFNFLTNHSLKSKYRIDRS